MAEDTRRRRIERILRVRARQLDVARAALASAARAAAEASAARSAAEGLWSQAAVTITSSPPRSVDALIDARAHLSTLRRRADLAAEALAKAASGERDARAACLRAEREHKKMTRWLEMVAEGEQAQAVRQERRAADEHAARVVMRKAS